MQDALSNVEVTTRNPEHVFMFRALVMYANLVIAQDYQGKFVECVIHHVSSLTLSLAAMSVTHVKAQLIQMASSGELWSRPVDHNGKTRSGDNRRKPVRIFTRR